MASIHLQGTLLDTLGEVDVGAVMTWTHLTNTGEVIATTKRDLIIPPNGFYSIDVEFGQIRIDYRTRNTERFIATVIVNGTSTATTIPELLNAAVPVTDPVIIQMQDILADAEAAAVTSEGFADQLTTFDLIGSVAVFAPDTNFRTKGYLTSGDGGAGHWVQNGVTAQPVSQSPAQLGDALLNDGSGNQWELITSMPFVKMFGVVGDDIVDDTAALQAACTGTFNMGLRRLYFDDVICSVSAITTSVEFWGSNCKVSVIHHNGINQDIMVTADGGTSGGRLVNMYNMGFWGAGFDSVWKTNILISMSPTSRGWNLENCEVGRYGVNGFGAEFGLKIDGFGFYKNVVNTHFDYNKHAVYLLNSGNDLGRQFTDCRFEHSQGYAAVLLGVGGRVSFTGCALQFNQGAGLSTEADTVDEVLNKLSGNTAEGKVQLTKCTVEQNNRGAWEYNLDGTDELVGYVNILNGSLSMDDVFTTASTGEDGQFALVDTSEEVTMVRCRSSASQIKTFLRGGNNLTGTVEFRDNLALGAAITTQYDINNVGINIQSFLGLGDIAMEDVSAADVSADKFIGTYKNTSQKSSSNLNPSNSTNAAFIDATSGNKTMNLGGVVHETGRTFTAVKNDGGVNTVNVVASGSLINGVTTYVLSSPWEKIELISNGTDWIAS